MLGHMICMLTHALLLAEGLFVALVLCGLSSGLLLYTGCQNRSAPAGDQAWTGCGTVLIPVGLMLFPVWWTIS
eukprot:249054-Pelagomonas_calceolata.AAC.1